MHVIAFGQHRLEATAPWSLILDKQTKERVTPSGKKVSPTDLAHFAMLSRGNCWLSVEDIPDPIPLTGGDCFSLARDTSIVLRDNPRTRPGSTFWEIAAKASSNVAHRGGGGVPTTVICGSLSFDRASLKPITRLLPSFILIKADQARTLEYVTEWRMQKAMQLLQQRDKKLIDVARLIGYESDATFSKALKRVVGSNPGAYLKRGSEDQGHAGIAQAALERTM